MASPEDGLPNKMTTTNGQQGAQRSDQLLQHRGGEGDHGDDQRADRPDDPELAAAADVAQLTAGSAVEGALRWRSWATNLIVHGFSRITSCKVR